MQLENQVCSLELAKKLKELGSNEVWVDIKGYEGRYQVNGCGFVRSLHRKAGRRSRRSTRLLGLFVKKGYMTVSLTTNGKPKTFLVHRLVANAFLQRPKGPLEVNHIDGEKLNNCYWNLEWCTKSYNQQHARRLGLQGGEHSNTAKVTVRQVQTIRALYATGKHKMKALGKTYGVNEQTVSKIINRHTWRYV